MKNAATLPGITKYLPGSNDRICVMLTVVDYDEGVYEERVVIWNTYGDPSAPRNYRAARIVDDGTYDVAWMVHDEFPVLDFWQVASVPEVITHLMGDEEGELLPENVVRVFHW
jgi:hypothetical protein